MKKLDEGQRIIAGIILGMGAVIIATQLALYFSNRQKSGAAPTTAAAAPPAAPPSQPMPGQV